MPPSDHQLLVLSDIMAMNNGVLRQADHLEWRAAFDYLVRQGTIVRVHPGVFADARYADGRFTGCAAALARFPRAVLWGETAGAALLGELAATPMGVGEELTLALPYSVKPIAGLQLVNRHVVAAHVRRVDGLRCPSAAFLAVATAAEDDGAMVERFLRAGIVRPDDLGAVLPAFRRSHGQALRRRVVATSQDNPWSGGERALHALLRRHRILGWQANVELIVEGRRCYPDVLFPEQRLVVEFDGYQVHSRPEAFEADRIRQNALTNGGYRVLRFTWKRLTTDEAGVLAELRRALRREPTGGTG